MLVFKILGETPAKKNSRINLRNGISIPSKRFKAWHENAEEQMMDQKAKLLKPDHVPYSVEHPVTIALHFCHGDLRRRDSDNGTSSIMDLLVDMGVLKDDNWQIVRGIHVSNTYEKGNPYCEIFIEEL